MKINKKNPLFFKKGEKVRGLEKFLRGSL